MASRPIALAVLGGVLLLVACASRPQDLGAWMGREAASLQQAWGAPTRQVEGDGGRILIYEELDRTGRQDFLNTYSAGPRTMNVPGLAVTVPPVRVRSYLFWVDTTGTIVRAEIRDP